MSEAPSFQSHVSCLQGRSRTWVSLAGSHVFPALLHDHAPYFLLAAISGHSFLCVVCSCVGHTTELTCTRFRFFSKCVFSEDLHGELQSFMTPLSMEGRDGWSSCTLDRPFSGYTALLTHFHPPLLMKNQLSRGGHSDLCDPAGQARPGALGHWSMNIKGGKCKRHEAGDRRGKERRPGGEHR